MGGFGVLPAEVGGLERGEDVGHDIGLDYEAFGAVADLVGEGLGGDEAEDYHDVALDHLDVGSHVDFVDGGFRLSNIEVNHTQCIQGYGHRLQTPLQFKNPLQPLTLMILYHPPLIGPHRHYLILLKFPLLHHHQHLTRIIKYYMPRNYPNLLADHCRIFMHLFDTDFDAQHHHDILLSFLQMQLDLA